MHFNFITFFMLAFASYGLTSSSILPGGHLPPGPLGLPNNLPGLTSPHAPGNVANNIQCRPPSQPDRKVQAYPNRQPKQEDKPTALTGELLDKPHVESASILPKLHSLDTVHGIIGDL